jgi:hypothetical protein
VGASVVTLFSMLGVFVLRARSDATSLAGLAASIAGADPARSFHFAERRRRDL